MRYLYVIRDEIADDYGPIFEAKSHHVAARSFQQLMKNAFKPGDFKLYCVGWFDASEGKIYDKEPEIIDVKIDMEVIKNG